MKTFKMQQDIAEAICHRLKFSKDHQPRVKPVIETGMGRHIIFCLVAQMLYPKSVGVLVRKPVIKQLSLTKENFEHCDLRINKVNTDYIIDDR